MANYLAVKIGNLKLRNPVLLASGTCGYAEELKGLINFKAIGGVIAKSITLKPRPGNDMPRVVECTGGMLNAIGLANVGVEKFCVDKLPKLSKLSCVSLVNIAGATLAEYLAVLEKIDGLPGVAGVEINVSCPNVKAGGIEFGRDPKVLEKLVKALRSKTKLPLWVKLSPNVTDITKLAQAAEAAGADALSVMNTLIGMRIDINKRQPILDNLRGGLSGPAIKPVAINLVYQVYKRVKIPIIGIGGISNVADALEFILAGATAIQVGTATFQEPKTAEKIVQGLDKYLKQNKMKSIKEIVGAAHKG